MIALSESAGKIEREDGGKKKHQIQYENKYPNAEAVDLSRGEKKKRFTYPDIQDIAFF